MEDLKNKRFSSLNEFSERNSIITNLCMLPPSTPSPQGYDKFSMVTDLSTKILKINYEKNGLMRNDRLREESSRPVLRQVFWPYKLLTVLVQPPNSKRSHHS